MHSAGERHGSEFAVLLPARDHSAHAPATLEVEAPSVPAPRDALLDGLKILLVEDEADAREAMAAVLASAGAQVEGAESAESARDRLTAQTFDVVLSDIGMPGEDGYSLVRSLRRDGMEMPAIAVTAFGRPEDKALALQAGFNAHLAKPVEPARLFDAIQALVMPESGVGTK